MLKQKNKPILEFLNPKHIYIPINNNYELTNNYIYKLENINNTYAPISGNFLHETYMYNYKNEKVKCIVIENDFKQKTKLKRKYREPKLKFQNKSHLIINAYDIDPYTKIKYMILTNYTEELLETIDYLLEKYNLKSAKIILPESDIKIINKYLGTYPNVSLINYSSSKSVSITTIFDIYNYLKYQKPITTKIINIVTPKHNLYINVRLGCSLKELLEKYNLYKDIDSNNLLIINSSINGSSIFSDELIITKEIDAIIFIKNHFTKTHECIDCGKCTNICPVNLIPSYIMKYTNNNDKLNLLKPQNCIECGLCSFICPSKIELMEHIIIAKEKVRK